MSGNVRRPLLTGDEICKIIEVCAKNSVARIAIGNVRIVFGSKQIESETPSYTQPKPVVHEDERSPAVERKESLDQLEDEIHETLITDPVTFEEVMTSEEFLDEADQIGSRSTKAVS